MFNGCSNGVQGLLNENEQSKEKEESKVNIVNESIEKRLKEINLPDDIPLPIPEITSESIINTKCPTCITGDNCFLKPIRGHMLGCGTYKPREVAK